MSANIVFNKERSIKACMADAWRMIVLNWKDYLCNLWPYLLIASIAYALFTEFTVQYACEQLLPALLLKESGGQTDLVKLLVTPTPSNIVALSVSFMFCFFSSLCVAAKQYRLIHHYYEHNSMPKRLPFAIDKTDIHCMLRMVKTKLFSLLLFLLASLPFVILSIKGTIWGLLAIPFIALYLFSYSVLCAMRHALYKKAFAPSIRFAFKHALGLVFILMLLTSIPVSIALLTASMPQVLYVLSQWAYTKSLLMGDVVSLPIGLPFVFFIINSICFAIGIIVCSYFKWTISLKCLNK